MQKQVNRLLLITILCISAVVVNAQLAKNFLSPPNSIATGVYWYWLSGNVSKEGVIKDLQAMKKVGINRAFIGNIALDGKDLPQGKVKLFSGEWWDITHTALKTASELGIEIGIFNSPGWSQSGGPWVKPEEAMRYLASSSTTVKGPGLITVSIPKPNKDFQDVKLIAFPASKNDLQKLDLQTASVISMPAINHLDKIFDGDTSSFIQFPAGKKLTIDFAAKENFTLRSIEFYPSRSPIIAEAELLVKKENGDYQTISTFEINRSKDALNVGFNPYGPVVISIPEITSRLFRIMITGAGEKSGLSELVLSSTPKVERYVEKTLGKMFQTPLPLWNEYQWLKQPVVKDSLLIIQTKEVLDLSKYMNADGILHWNAPKGSWIILRTGMTPTGTTNSPATPEATGLEIDKMSKQHVEKHFNAFIGKILARIPAADRKTFKVVVQDSYETGGQNFTDELIPIFQKKYGYDPLPYLPVFSGYVVGSQDRSDRFLWDLRRLIADKVSYDYVGGLKGISHKYGLKTWLENYGHWGFPGEFLQYGGQSDEVSGEFWSEGELGNIENRAASSSAHIYGKTKVTAESFTCAGNAYSRSPAMLKARGDRFFSEGINSTLLHVYIHQPDTDKFPGLNAWFGNEFNRNNTMFPQMDLFIQYLKRCNLMLQQGLNIADVAYFIGEDAPKMTGVRNPPLPLGYQFDYINAEVILKNMTVQNGLLTLPHGTQYRILVLPDLKTMRPELIHKIDQLVNAGAVVLGNAPEYSPSLTHFPEADKEVKSIAQKLWGKIDGNKIKKIQQGKGWILSGMSMEEALSFINCKPDCRIPGDTSILYNHRKTKEEDIYFITNQKNSRQSINLEFRVKDIQPELWDPTTGKNRKLLAYIQKSDITIIPLVMEPAQSFFIVFKNKAKPKFDQPADNFPAPQNSIMLNNPWVVSFAGKFRVPAPIVMNTLQDLTENPNDSIKYFSGTINYAAQFNMPKVKDGNSILLALQKVNVMAKVYINGLYVGGLWTAPYHVDITKFIREGQNQIRIEVVNTWVNRMIGDLNLAAADRKTYSNVNPYKADTPLQSSGLVGPVQIFELAQK